ncbi:Subtilase family protein [Halogranum rubrum]|uniref:Subtilase family protein n=1 Tax=Halogranum rubrum TaxID=553466 RepID=A0A1I4CL27_9EURY|nr:S8 family peptidase [Halogranum rubrum]SFK80661.1 Subtilase family protein [Halogranum rubrum]
MNPGSVEISRRDVLKVAGGGTAIGLLTTPASARTPVRVFVHPRPGRDVTNTIERHGGVARLYEHFQFVAAVVPVRALKALRRDRRIAVVEPDGIVRAVPVRASQAEVAGQTRVEGQSASWGYTDIAADSAQALGVTGKGVDVAILDTGIDVDHRDLRVAGGVDCVNWLPWEEQDYDDQNGHGTHCAGIAAARDDGGGVVGVAPDANLYAVRVLDSDKVGYWSDVIRGIDWCLSRRIPVLSMSFGGDSISNALRETLETAANRGHILVAAAGNDGNDGNGDCTEQNVDAPARNHHVLGVSATDSDGEIASYSSVGRRIELAAPGTSIYSTFKNQAYATFSGTSMATPYVAGAAALVWQESDYGHPTSDEGERVREVLTSTARVLDGTCGEGSGLVDAYEAVRAVRWA